MEKLDPMKLDRRRFLALSASMLALPSLSWALKPLKILILGGTGFIGPHQVECAIGRGHQVTLFNRGKTSPKLFPQVQKLRGDRDSDLKALETGEWDAVIDNSGGLPRWVRQSGELLRGRVKHYLYISTISVYADHSELGQKENGKVLSLADPKTEDQSRETYGGRKALCEQVVRELYPTQHSVFRPGLVVGPGDPTDRFTYWPVRVYRGGEILAPGHPTDPIQWIDARDLAQWTIESIERRNYGTYNVTGPAERLSMGDFLYVAQKTTNSDSKFTWVDQNFLREHKVHPWTDLPLWVPPNTNFSGFTQVNIDRALASGIRFRSVAETIQDSLAWYRMFEKRDMASLQAGLSLQREAELLRKWHGRKS